MRQIMSHHFIHVVVLFLVLFSTTDAVVQPRAGRRRELRVPVSPLCKSTANEQLCMEMAGGAQNPHDAAVNAMRATMNAGKDTELLSGVIAPALSKLSPSAQNGILDACKDGFKNAILDLQFSLEAFEANKRDDINSYLTGAVMITSECEDGLNDFGVSFPLNELVVIKNFKERLTITITIVNQQ